MKLRFSSLDVAVTAHELSQILVGMRLQNIYDLSSRIFLFRFHKSAPTSTRVHIILDSGFRIHTTSFSRDTPASPSVFVQRLRKILGTRRVTAVKQIGTDRILEIQFSEGSFKLYLEFYAGGNLVLTDGEQKVVAVQRLVEEEGLKLGGEYKLDGKQNVDGVRDVTEGRVLELLRVARDAAVGDADADTKGAVEKKKKKKKGSKSAPLRKAIAQLFSEFPAVLLEHAEIETGFSLDQQPDAILNDEELVKNLIALLKTAQSILKSVTISDAHKGFIVSKRKPTKDGPGAEDLSPGSDTLIYSEYHPFKPRQFEENPDTYTILEFDSFSAAVDKFYSSIEGQKLGSRRTELEEKAKEKMEAARKLHHERLGGLKKAQEIHIRKAEAIQANVERVQEATIAVNGLIAQGMDWVDISRLIEAEQVKGNPVARTIKLPLKLYENTVTLLLGESNGKEEVEEDEDGSSSTEEDSDSGEESRPLNSALRSQPRQPQDERLSIDIDLSLTAWANASQYYDQKKQAVSKHDRTEEMSTLAIRNVERKITADLKKGLSQEKAVMRPLRQIFWFEKFYYFISSDGHLVLAGKDPSQSDILYQKYFRPGDVFVHADVPGAVVTIIKNFGPDKPVPPGTLSQAGTFAVLSSTAWDSKALMAAWWVGFDQVSKVSATAGDVLPAGKFEIEGKKNFLPPAQLLAGIAVVFGIGAARERISEAEIEAEPVNDGTGAGDDQELASEATFETVLEASESEAEDEDSDEDFPDTAAPVPAYDSDEDFPDVSAPAVVDSEEDDEPPAENPLQPILASTSKPVPSSLVQPQGTSTENVSANTSSASTPHKHLSAHQRRLLKKTGIALSHTSKADEDQDEGYESDGTTATYTTLNTVAQANRNALLPRGKRTKMKKAKQKYAEQDEDERVAALAKLGSRIGDERREIEARERRAKAETEEAERDRIRQRKEDQARRLEANRVQRITNAAASSARDGTVPGEAAQPEEDDMDLSILSTLTGKPKSTDDIVFALPVFAPWTALANFKYKTKLQPGAMKKGKAAKEVLGMWQAAGKVPKHLDREGKDPERMWPREVECVAGIKDTEVIACVSVRGVKIMTSGGSANSGGGKNGKGDKGKPGGKGGKRKK